MSFLVQKLHALDVAIVEGKTKSELRGYIVDLLDYLATHEGDLTMQNDILRSEFTNISERNKALKAELYDAKAALEKAMAPQREKEDANEEKQNEILLFLSTKRGPIVAASIANNVGIGEQACLYHLRELEKAKLTIGHISMGGPVTWSLGSEGRAKLFRLGHLK